MTDENDDQTPTFLQTFKSGIAAMFGVQKSETLNRDFSKGKPSHFIFMGLILTALFIVSVWTIVQIVLYFMGA